LYLILFNTIILQSQQLRPPHSLTQNPPHSIETSIDIGSFLRGSDAATWPSFHAAIYLTFINPRKVILSAATRVLFGRKGSKGSQWGWGSSTATTTQLHPKRGSRLWNRTPSQTLNLCTGKESESSAYWKKNRKW